jgi:hypothetical protein
MAISFRLLAGEPTCHRDPVATAMPPPGGRVRPRESAGPEPWPDDGTPAPFRDETTLAIFITC